MPRFSKYSGAGNDFVLVEAGETERSDPAHLARRICPRATGVGVDGLVLVQSLSPERLRVRFFNPDGSEFSTCGNGSRCAARYAVQRGLADGPGVTLVTDAGEVEAEVRGDRVALRYRLDARVDRELEVRVGETSRTAWLVQIGTPHLVVAVPELPEEHFEELARPLRRLAALGPEGANVDFVEVSGTTEARIRTFERGVEGETLACGSGAMAAALALGETGRLGSEASFHTRSGSVLRVGLEHAPGHAEPGGSPATDVRVVRLEGPALFVFEGYLPDLPPDAGG